MSKSNLPPAKLNQQDIVFGNITIKVSKPSQTLADAKKGLDNLEKAAKDKVFNEPTE